MTVEAAGFITDIDPTQPVGTDGKNEGDNHLRNFKSSVQSSLPNISGAVTATHTELNNLDGYTGNTNDLNILSGAAAGGLTAAELLYVAGTTSDIQTQLDARAALASPALTGNPTAPTQATGDNDTSIATTAFVQQELTADNALRAQLETLSSLHVYLLSNRVGEATGSKYEFVDNTAGSGRLRATWYEPCISNVSANTIGAVATVNNKTASAITLRLTIDYEDNADDAPQIRVKVNGTVQYTSGTLTGGATGQEVADVNIPASTDASITVEGIIASGSGSDSLYLDGISKAEINF